MEIRPNSRLQARAPRNFQVTGEDFVFLFTVFSIVVLFLVISTSTLLIGTLIALLFLGYSYLQISARHQRLKNSQTNLPPQVRKKVRRLAQQAADRLQVDTVNILIANGSQVNAYAFGMGERKDIVLFSPLLQLLDDAELQSVIGHEMGHVLFGHTTVNTLIGGLGGISGNIWINLLLRSIFRSWTRLCEYSADRAAVLACSQPESAISALVKVETGGKARSDEEIALALEELTQHSGSPTDDLVELLRTHPMTYNRIKRLQDWTRSNAYKKLQRRANENLTLADEP